MTSMSSEPKRDVRLKHHPFSMDIAVNVPYSEINAMLAPEGISKLYHIRDLIDHEIVFVDTVYRPQHVASNRGCIASNLIKGIEYVVFSIQQTEDEKLLIVIRGVIHHWSRITGIDMIGLHGRLVAFFENKILPGCILFVE